MAKRYDELQPQQMEFIQDQHLFFVGSAGKEGFVNVSPKGMDSLRVMSSKRILWLNLTGSGNETAAHVLESPRMTIMFCSFEKQPLILRVYGEAKIIHPKHPDWPDLIGHFPGYAGARQIFDVDIQLVQTSCGFAVPLYDFKSERDTLINWAEKQGPLGIKKYWAEKNAISLNGKTTGMEDE